MSQVRGLNNLGEVAGGNGSQALLYRGGQMINLGTLVGTNTSIAVAINDSGQVVVRSPTTTDVRSRYAHVYLYSGGGMSDLGTPGDNPLPTAINNNGEIVGSFNGNYGQAAVIYSGGQWTNVLSPNVSYAHAAYGINSGGQIAMNVLWGGYLFSSGQQTAVGFTVSRLGADVINESGQVVGWTGEWAFDTNHHAFLYSGGVPIDLGTLGGTWSEAYAINNNGQIVGNSRIASGATRPFIYNGGTMTDLGSLIADLRIHSLAWDTTPGALKFVHTNSGSSFASTPIAVNDQGQILCSDGRLLTPVTAPSTCAQLFWATGPSVSDKISGIFSQTILVGPGGSSASVQVPAANLQNRPANATHVVLVLNCDNQFPESDTNNNTAALDLRPPDLLPSSLAWNVNDGGLSFAYTVQTGITARAATSADIFWATGTAASNRIGSALSSQSIPAAFSGQSSNFTVSAWVFDSPPPNASHVMLVVDIGNLVTESSEENNVMALAFPRPDLVPAYFRWAASEQDLEFSYTVQTGRTAIASTTAKLFWANGAAISNQMSSTPLFTANIPAGASGQSSNIIVSAANLQNPPPNATHVLLRLDPDNLVGEENETNNTSAINLALPDLFPRSFNWSATGGGLDFSYTVRTGFVATAASTAKIFWADGAGLSNVLSSTPIFTVDIPTGTSGTSPLVHVPAENFLTPANGTIKVLLVLDADNTVAEGDEANNTLAIPYQNDPAEVNGRVLDSTNHLPLAGATVTLGSQSTTSSASGQYAFTNVSQGNATDFSVSKSGYATHIGTVDIPWEASVFTLPDIFLVAITEANSNKPIVTAVEPSLKGLFLSGVSLNNDFKASVNWNGLSPGYVRFAVNGVTVQNKNGSGPEYSATLNMGSAPFQPSFDNAGNEITAQAFASSGETSEPYPVYAGILPLPDPLKFLTSQGWPFTTYLDGHLGLDYDWPNPPWKANLTLPVLGRFGFEMAFNGSFDYTVTDGDWEAAFGFGAEGKKGKRGRRPSFPGLSRYPKMKLYVGNKEISGKLQAGGGGTATFRNGIKLENYFGHGEIEARLELGRVGLLDVVPGLGTAAGSVPGLSDVTKGISIIIYLVPGIEGDVTFNAQPQFQFDSFELTGKVGLEAAYEPELSDDFELRVYVGGEPSVTFGYPGDLFKKIRFRAYAGAEFKAWVFQFGPVEYVFVDVSYPSAASFPVVARATDGTTGVAQLRVVSAGGEGLQVVSRGYLEAGLEEFLPSPRATRLAASIPTSDLGLETFRKIGRKSPKASPSKEGAPGPQEGPTPDGDAEVDQADLVLVQNVFPGSSPAMASKGQELMLLYVTDNGSTNNLQFTDIKWTRFDGTNWSVSATIQTNTQAEFSPQVTYDGNGDAIAVWERVADANFSLTNLTAMAAQMEIVWSKWDHLSDQWSVPQALTANGYLDHAPLLCGPMSDGSVLATWTANMFNLLIGTNGAGSQVLTAEWNPSSQSWSAPQALLADLPNRLSQSLSGVSNVAVYAWSRDLDGVLTNANDNQVFYSVWSNGLWSAVSPFTSDTNDNRNARVSVGPDGHSYLVWQSGTNLVLSRDFSTNATLVRTDSQSAGFSDYAMTIGPAGNLTMLWQEMSEAGSNPRYRVLDPVSATWSQDARLFADPPLERSFAPVWDDVGNLTVAYNMVQMSYTNKTVALEGGGTVTITNVPQPGRVDLCVTKRQLIKDVSLAAGDFAADAESFLPGALVSLSATVRNSGNLAVSNLLVNFYDGDPNNGGVLIANTSIAGWMEGAATNTVVATWVVPEPPAPHVLYVMLDPTNAISEFDERNNQQSLSIGGTDLAVSLVRQSVETNGALRIIAQVQNLGAPAATNCTLSIRLDGNTNALPLGTVAVPSLRPGRTAELALQLPPGTHAPGESLYTLAVDEAHLNSDVDTNNNQTSFAVMLWLDSDGDGMPDHWEAVNGLNPYDPSDASADADQDGLSNLEEFEQSKNPNLFDNLRVVTSQRLSNGQFQLTAFVERGRNYFLEASTNLVDWDSILAFTATNSPVTLVDTSAHDLPQRFYRLRLSADQPPVIRMQPVNSTNHIGSLVSFTVNAEGSAPLRYHWRREGTDLSDGGNLSGTTNNAVFIANVSPADAGNYDVVVSNAYGSVTSQVAALTVTTNGLGFDLLAYFPFEGDALDASGNDRDGIVQGAVLTTNRFGDAGSAYVFNGGNSIQVNNLDPDIYTNGFSFGAWIRPDAYSGVLGWTYDAGWGATYLAAGGSTVAFRIGTGSPATDHGVSASVPLGGWSHLFVTHHPTNDALYLNGVLVGQWPSYPMQGNVSTFLIGSSYAGNFVGAIDEVAVFGREVSSNEVAAIYAGGLGGQSGGRSPKILSQPSNAIRAFGSSALFSVVVSGTAPLAYQWRHEGATLLDGTEIWGATTANLVLTNLQQSAVGNYDVVVTNDFGSVTSSVASLSLQTGVIPEALLLYLPFNGDALDASGNARDGAVAGALLTTNRLNEPNSAYAFNGSSLITVTNLDPDNYTNGFSFGGWVRSDSGGGSPVYWVHDLGWGSTYIILAAPGGLSFRLGSGSPSTAYSINGLNLGLGHWHHLFVTHDTSWNRFFVDGVKVFESASLPLLGNVSTLEMGRDGFVGAVDEFMVFGRGLPTDEVSLIYQVGLNLTPKAKFASPTVTASSVLLPISGTAGSSWGMDRAISISGPWTNIGSVLLDGTGAGFFQDTNPPAGAAYYRARQP